MKRPRQLLAAPSEEMRHVAALLAKELLEWPGVTARPMFGMRAFFRGAKIFALLPERRAFGAADAIAYKQAGGGRNGRPKWQPFHVRGRAGVSAALARLHRSYKAAGRMD